MTQLLDAVRDGDEHAADRLLPLVYEELRKLAHQRMAHEPLGHTLDATSLVHEAYLRLVGDADSSAPDWNSRGHFFGAAAEAMRRILVERARRYEREKHGAGARRLQMREGLAATEPESVDLIGLDEALARLEQRDPRMSEIVKLRFFAGLTIEQTALALAVTSRTVNRRWIAAKTWLRREMTGRVGARKASDAG